MRIRKKTQDSDSDSGIRIWLHPFGRLHPALLAEISQKIEERFFILPYLGQSLPLPRLMLQRKRHQYASIGFLKELSKLGVRETEVRLGITRADLFAPSLNFIFGEASPEEGTAVFSIARLDPINYGRHPNPKLLIQRATKEAVHELGHVFGLRHCDHLGCVMVFSNTLEDTDLKSDSFCKRCSSLLYLGRLQSAS